MSETIWVSTHSGLAGWMRRGTLPAAKLPGGDFWSRALRVACKAEGGFIDAAQCYDAAILTAGPMQCTARFGTLQKLLAAVPDALLEKHLKTAFDASDIHLRRAPPSFVFGSFTVVADEPGLRRAFLGGSNGRSWDEEQKQRAFAWVEGLGQLLLDPGSLPFVAGESSTLLRSYADPAAQLTLKFEKGEPPTYMKKAAACYLAFAINNPRGALALLRQTGADAERMLTAAQTAGPWPATFPQRVSRTMSALVAEEWS